MSENVAGVCAAISVNERAGVVVKRGPRMDAVRSSFSGRPLRDDGSLRNEFEYAV